MHPIPKPLQVKFADRLRNKAVPIKNHGAFKKWLRYYRDFCQKYHFPATQKEILPPFLRKLQEKRQTKVQQDLAGCAIGVFYEIMDGNPPNQISLMGQGNTLARKRKHKDMMQRSVHEDSSKPWWGPQCGSSEGLQPPKRASA